MRHTGSSLVVSLYLAACQAGAADSGPAELRVEPDLVIASEEDVPQSFGDVRGVVTDPAGRIYVLEADVPEVRVFSRDGEFIRRIGRGGQGPGEFVRPNGLAISPAGELFVYDPRASRITAFDTAGRLSATHPLPIGMYGYLWEGGVDSSGRVVDRQVRQVDTTLVPIVRRFDPVTGRSDTLELPECEVPPAPVYRFARGISDVPFASGRRVILEPGGWSWCADDAAAVAWRRPPGGGPPVDTFESVATAERVTAHWRRAAIARVEQLWRSDGGDAPDLSLMPETWPVLVGVDTDQRGRVWMRVRDSAGPAIHLFAPGRRWIARIRHGQLLSPWHRLDIRGDTVVAVAWDSLEVPRIVRLVVPLDGVGE